MFLNFTYKVFLVHFMFVDKADQKKILGKRKKDQDRDNDDGLSSLQKKPRVAWSIDLHRKFVAAVNQLGLESKYFRWIENCLTSLHNNEVWFLITSFFLCYCRGCSKENTSTYECWRTH